MSLPVIVIGAGGHAKVLIDALIARSVRIIGATDSDPAKGGVAVLGVTILDRKSVV